MKRDYYHIPANGDLWLIAVRNECRQSTRVGEVGEEPSLPAKLGKQCIAWKRGHLANRSQTEQMEASYQRR